MPIKSTAQNVTTRKQHKMRLEITQRKMQLQKKQHEMRLQKLQHKMRLQKMRHKMRLQKQKHKICLQKQNAQVRGLWQEFAGRQNEQKGRHSPLQVKWNIFEVKYLLYIFLTCFHQDMIWLRNSLKPASLRDSKSNYFSCSSACGQQLAKMKQQVVENVLLSDSL